MKNELPKYLEMVLIRCIVCRQQVVKANGNSVCSHTELHHKFSRGEKAYVCRKCWNNLKERKKVDMETWKEAETIKITPDYV